MRAGMEFVAQSESTYKSLRREDQQPQSEALAAEAAEEATA
jgi:hypothetical protein